ncbi:MAG: hypothetical protein P8103_17075 [Candidatus Thiodiazotropha sp.]|jgi:hypothetical protein
MKRKATDVFIYTREVRSEGQFARLSEQFFESSGIVSMSQYPSSQFIDGGV